MAHVVLGLSGGVDSAVCALLLRDMGHSVTGVYLENGGGDGDDARTVADSLGINFMSINISDALETQVIKPFVDGYMCGTTPIPCIVCNPLVKFFTLMRVCDDLGAQFIATGHYARISTTPDGEKCLCRLHSPNDQSYMLYRLEKSQIDRLLLPLSDFSSKDFVRAKALEYGLSVAKKADSMEICFIPNDDHATFIESRVGAIKCGNFVDERGAIICAHHGIHRYTVGQRRGLGVSAASRLFVKTINADTGDITISATDPVTMCADVIGLHIIYNKYIDTPNFECTCKVRHSKHEYVAVVTVKNDSAHIEFKTPARAPAAGQSAVFYDGDIVIGGGFIV